jgi:integrase
MTIATNRAATQPHNQRRTLRPGEWPDSDRRAWEEACRPSRRLQRGGAASYLAPASRESFALRYGLFLGFLKQGGRLDCHAPAASQVTPSSIEAYVVTLSARVSSVTVYNCIYHLRRAVELIAPSQNFSWLAELEKDLALVMQPRSKLDRLFFTEQLVRAGLILMAESSDFTGDFARARGIRNGLMIVLLALYPSRRKNFATLELGTTFQTIRGSWWMILPALITKSRRPDERRVAAWLNPWIKLYVDECRPILRGTNTVDTNALWISSKTGGPLTVRKVGMLISAVTLERLGVALSPHLFRCAAATSAATHSSNMRHLGSAILNHRDPRVTEEHYNRASSISAANTYATIIGGYYT